ncbi:MAG TPA: hypothetical protein VH593_16945, partial [Ktedonobacteraceae bacterium]
DADMEGKNSSGAWTLYQGTAGALSVPTYNALGYLGVYGDFFGVVDVGTNVAINPAGVTQGLVTFRNSSFTTGEWIGASTYVRSSRTGNILIAIMDQAGNTLGQNTYAATNSWQRIYTRGQTLAGTTGLRIVIQATGGGTAWVAHDTFAFDASQLHRFETTNVAEVPNSVATLVGWTKTISIFDGYIENWPQGWPGGMDAQVAVSAVDGFKPLAPMSVVRGEYNLVVGDDTPTWYFRLGEQDPAQAARNESAPNIQDGTYNIQSGSPQLGIPQAALVGDTTTQLQFTGQNGEVHRNNVVIPAKQFAWEGIVQLNPNNYPGGVPTYSGAASGDNQVFFAHGNASITNGSMVVLGFQYKTGVANTPYNGMYFFAAIMSAAQFEIFYLGRNPAGTAAYHTQPHLLGFSWDGTGADGRGGWPLFWYDGVAYDPSTDITFQKTCGRQLFGYGNTAPAQANLGKLAYAGTSAPMYIGNTWDTLWGCRNVYIEEVAYWVSTLPKTGWGARHFNAWSYGAAQEDSGTRMGHLLDQASIPGTGQNPWPTSRRDIAVGQSQVIPFRWNEQTLMDLIKQDAASEGGIFFF